MSNINSTNTEDFYCDFVLSGKLEVNKIKESNKVVAFHHTKPSYEFHVVIVPKEHITMLLDVTNMDLIKEIFELARDIIKENKLNETNFRIITNGGSFQDSKHLHFHLISGNKLE